MREGTITMSQKEGERVQVIQRTIESRGYQAAAARQLGLRGRLNPCKPAS